MSDLMRSCCGQNMKRVETEVTGDGVLWACLECQRCDRIEWVRGFNAPQPSLFDLKTAVNPVPVLAGAFG